jgi:hypothetical protein
VRGPFRTVPRVDEGSFEVGKNERGQFFIRPRTEMTGLDPAYRALFAAFDRETAAQSGQIERSYADAAKAAQADADALTARLGSLGQLASQAGSQVPQGATTGIGQDILQTGARSGVREAALDVNIGSLLPTTLRGQGASELAGFRGSRSQSRTKALFDARAAAAEAEAQRQQLAATLRGQDIDLTSKKLGIAADLDKAQIAADVAAANQAAQDRRAAADRASRERIAREKLASGGSSGGAAGGAAQGLGAAANDARRIWEGTPPKRVTDPGAPDYGEVVPGTGVTPLPSRFPDPIFAVGPLFRNMIGRGLTPQQAKRIVQATVGNALWNKWFKIQGRKFGL